MATTVTVDFTAPVWAPLRLSIIGVGRNTLEAALSDLPPFLDTLGARELTLECDFDQNRKTPADPTNHALRTTGSGAALSAMDGAPSDWLLSIEDDLAALDVGLSIQLIGAPPGFQPAQYARPAIHPAPTDTRAAGAVVRQWMRPQSTQAPNGHRLPVRWVLWNEPGHTLTEPAQTKAISGATVYPTEDAIDAATRRRAHKAAAVDQLAGIAREWFAQGDHVGPWDQFTWGTFLCSDTRHDMIGRLMPDGRSFFGACVDLHDREATLGTARRADSWAFNSYFGQHLADGAANAGCGWLPQSRRHLGPRASAPVVLQQYAPERIAVGTDEDGDGDPDGAATRLAVACDTLTHLDFFMRQPDVARVGVSYAIGAGVHSLVISGAPATLSHRGAALSLLAAVPPRRCEVSGVLANDGEVYPLGLRAVAGVASARACVLIWNTSTAAESVNLVRTFPSSLSGRSKTLRIYTLTEASPTPSINTGWNGSSAISVPAESVVLVEFQVTAQPAVTSRRRPLGDGTRTPRFLATTPHNGRPGQSYAYFDQLLGLAQIGMDGTQSPVSCAATYRNLPDTLHATLFAFGVASSAVRVGVDVELNGTVYRLADLQASAITPGQVVALNLAAAGGSAWAAGARLGRLILWASGPAAVSAGTFAEIWLSGTASAAAAVNG